MSAGPLRQVRFLASCHCLAGRLLNGWAAGVTCWAHGGGLALLDEFSVFQSTQKRYGSHGQSIWMQLELHRWQRAAKAIDLSSLVERRKSLPAAYGSKPLRWITAYMCQTLLGHRVGGGTSTCS